MALSNTKCPLSSMLTLSTLVLLLVEQCISNVPREHDFKALFKKSYKFSSLAHPALASDCLYRLGVLGAETMHLWVHALLLRLQFSWFRRKKYHFSVEICWNVASVVSAALARFTIHIFGRGRAKSGCSWARAIGPISSFYITLRIIKRSNICFIRVKTYVVRKHTLPV